MVLFQLAEPFWSILVFRASLLARLIFGVGFDIVVERFFLRRFLLRLAGAFATTSSLGRVGLFTFDEVIGSRRANDEIVHFDVIVVFDGSSYLV
jgi:hypothetical protein